MKAGKIINNNKDKSRGWKYQKDYHYRQDLTLIKTIEREASKI